MKNKGDFIVDLLSNKNLSIKDRERILKLSATEFEKNDQEYQRILSEIEGFKKIYQVEQANLSTKIDGLISEIKTLNSNDSSPSDKEKSTKIESTLNKNVGKTTDINFEATNLKKSPTIKNNLTKEENTQKTIKTPETYNNLPIYRRPFHLYEFLFSYNQNHILKSTCHEIDSNEIVTINKYCNKDEYTFGSHLEIVLSEFETHESKHPNAPNFIKALIRGYLTGKKYDGKDLKGWSTDSVKVNWSHESIKKYTSENNNTPPNLSQNILRSKKMKPCRIVQINSIINGNTVQTFRELVLHFKNLIHIKADNSLKSIVIKINELNEWNDSIDFIIDDDKFNTNIELFTDVDKLVQAYNVLMNLIIERHNANGKPKVILGLIQKDKTIEFSIHHINNQHFKNLQDTLERPIGSTYKNLINNQLNGVCNLYVNADFGDNQFACINIWDRKRVINATTINNISGVEYILEFEKHVI